MKLTIDKLARKVKHLVIFGRDFDVPDPTIEQLARVQEAYGRMHMSTPMEQIDVYVDILRTYGIDLDREDVAGMTLAEIKRIADFLASPEEDREDAERPT